MSRVHDGCVNLESWSVHSETEVSGVDIRDGRFGDDDITGNVELELNIEAAERLITALQAAVDELRGEMKTEYDLSQLQSHTNPYASKLKKPA